MKYYLITEYTYYYDPHGSQDYGGVIKYVSNDAKWNDEKKGVELFEKFWDNWNEETETMESREWLEELTGEEEWYGEDGYNCHKTSYIIKEINGSQYRIFDSMIKAYEAL